MVRWNDQGQGCEVHLNGVIVQVDDEKTLRDLYAILDFMFGKPS